MTQTETPKTEPQEPSEAVPAKVEPSDVLVPMTKEVLVAWLNADDIDEDDNNDDLDYELAVRILTADDSAAVLKQDDVRPIATLEDRDFVVRGVTWRKSTKSDDGKGRYAVLSCVDMDGEAFLTSCGATKVVLQLRKAEISGWFPWHVVLNTETTSNNRTIYELVAPTPDF